MARTATKAAKVYTYECGHCGSAVTRDRKLPADCTVDCGAAACRIEVTRAHNAAVVAARQARAEYRRANPRPARQPQPLYGDFAQLAAFRGLRTDGTGRRA